MHKILATVIVLLEACFQGSVTITTDGGSQTSHQLRQSTVKPPIASYRREDGGVLLYGGVSELKALTDSLVVYNVGIGLGEDFSVFTDKDDCDARLVLLH